MSDQSFTILITEQQQKVAFGEMGEHTSSCSNSSGSSIHHVSSDIARKELNPQ
jgi:hypothetical protein